MKLPLLQSGEPPCFTLENVDGQSPFLILCDHAGQYIPQQLKMLGLPQHEIDRHIGWDIGALAVSQKLSRLLDATLIHQTYSRLVIDCNRRPGIESSIPQISEQTVIPGNQGISEQQRQARCDEIFTPYHDAIRQVIDQRKSRGQPTCIIAMHSFTPVFFGEQRPWHIGVLYNRLPEYALSVLNQLQQRNQWVIGDNEPYRVSDDTDFAVPEHAEKNHFPYVEIEIRQDLISDQSGQMAWAKEFASLLPAALNDYLATTAG